MAAAGSSPVCNISDVSCGDGTELSPDKLRAFGKQ
jgi:hypothetical protein